MPSLCPIRFRAEFLPQPAPDEEQAVSPQHYLPSIYVWVKEGKVQDPREDLLDKLANSSVMPFTSNQEGAFTWSRRISHITTTYLGPKGFASIIACGLSGGMAGVRIAKYADIPDDSWMTDAIPFAFGAFAGASAAILGMIYTGTLPVAQSNAANKEQDICHDLEFQYTQAALRLVEMFWSKKPEKYARASRLATDIGDNLDNIKKRIKKASTRPEVEERIVRVLAACINYIKSGAKLKVLIAPLSTHIQLEQIRKKSKKPPGLAQ